MVFARQQLYWGFDDRIVFAWERDGWNHLYSVSIEGGDARLLTPGAFEIEHVTMSPDTRHIYFSSNEGDINRRHIWRSPVLLIHGDDDRNVFFSQTTRLVRELRKRGVDFEQLVFPDEVHGFLLHENWVKAYRATANFLVRKLGD